MSEVLAFEVKVLRVRRGAVGSRLLRSSAFWCVSSSAGLDVSVAALYGTRSFRYPELEIDIICWSPRASCSCVDGMELS